MPVDALFRSLAESCGEAAVGVVLSGADSDGAPGTMAIKHAGGITFAQQPESARVPGMPGAPSRRTAWVLSCCPRRSLPSSHASLGTPIYGQSHRRLRPKRLPT